MQERVKYCPRCEAEYLATAATCADCGVALVWSLEESPQLDAAPIREEEVDELIHLRSGETDWMDLLEQMLLDAGIPCRHDVLRTCRGRSSCSSSCDRTTWSVLGIRPEDEAEARRIEKEFEKNHILPLTDGEQIQTDGMDCPACGAQTSEDQNECPDCGLVFTVEDDVDPTYVDDGSA